MRRTVPGARLLPAFVLLAAAPPALAHSAADRFTVCAACHGKAGQSELPETPSLGGQPAFYVLAQLFLFREGRRELSPMTDVAKGMSNDDLRTYSEIVSRLPPPRPPAAAPDAPRIARGQSVAEKHQCGTCHQPDYAGRENVPRVANQREDYLLKVLREYKTGKRVGYGNAVMPETVSGLSDADLQDVAHFLAYRPPRP